jgi:hypothetical protein
MPNATEKPRLRLRTISVECSEQKWVEKKWAKRD